jgi:hypothetical protein
MDPLLIELLPLGKSHNENGWGLDFIDAESVYG